MSVKHDQLDTRQLMHVHVEAARQPRACVSMASLMFKGQGSVGALIVPCHAQRRTRGVSNCQYSVQQSADQDSYLVGCRSKQLMYHDSPCLQHCARAAL